MNTTWMILDETCCNLIFRPSFSYLPFITNKTWTQNLITDKIKILGPGDKKQHIYINFQFWSEMTQSMNIRN